MNLNNVTNSQKQLPIKGSKSIIDALIICSTIRYFPEASMNFNGLLLNLNRLVCN